MDKFLRSATNLTRVLLAFALISPLLLSGCHSAFVEASVVNHSGAAIRLVEVDYPSASVGTQDLPDGATFKYRFKILGNGPARLSWTDLQSKDHTSPGPNLQEGEEGTLAVTLRPADALWDIHLRPKDAR